MRVAVLGAGLLGTCVAMDLADHKVTVDLYDRNPAAMTQASLQNEGKIHLGYVYANDRSGRSAATMVEGAATFAPFLARWLGLQVSEIRHSGAFNYAVHRDSLLSVDQVETHLRLSHEMARRRIGDGSYFGIDLATPPARLSEADVEEEYDTRAVQAVYRTQEVGIDPANLARTIRDRVEADPHIHPVFNTEIQGVEVGGRDIEVICHSGDGPGRGRYDHVVNALWDGRLKVDSTLGLAPERPWLFRLKYYLRLRSSTTRLPSTTIVLGRFGDVVDYLDGSVYLSWYPTGIQAQSSGLEPPVPIPVTEEPKAEMIRRGILHGLASVIPGVAGIPDTEQTAAEILGGVIFAWGATDIDDPNSGLHNRFSVGPHSFGNYHTVDTGKLTLAPLFARSVADRVRGVT